MNRVLLETDSPFGGDINTPVFIGDVASQVAPRLKVTTSIRCLLRESVLPILDEAINLIGPAELMAWN